MTSEPAEELSILNCPVVFKLIRTRTSYLTKKKLHEKDYLTESHHFGN